MRAAFTSPDGLTRLSGEEERHVAFTVVMVVTDERILFVGGDAPERGLGQDAGSLAYDDLAAVGVEGGEPAVLTLSMANGVRWEFPLPDADPAVVDAVVRHLQWIGELRSRIVACWNDLELATGEIRDNAEAMNWEEAEAIYDEHRETLDQLICAVQWTEPIEDHVVAPELTDMERTLERAYARLYIERAQSQLELGQQLVENEDYDQARKVLQTAQEYYERADERADAVERGDAFRFGEQRELRDELDRLEWEIEAVAAEPIRQAHEAKIMATNATDLERTVEHWETAFRRYGNVLQLDGGDDRNFAGDPEEVRTEMRDAADRLINGYRELAREKWNEGVTLERNGAVKSALRTCTDAQDHVERAAELAREFRPEEVQAIEQRYEAMAQVLREMRETATVDRQQERETDTPAGVETGPPQGGSEDLSELDSHQEITFEATVEGAADGGRRHERGYTVTDSDLQVQSDTSTESAGTDAEETQSDSLADLDSVE